MWSVTFSILPYCLIVCNWYCWLFSTSDDSHIPLIKRLSSAHFILSVGDCCYRLPNINLAGDLLVKKSSHLLCHIQLIMSSAVKLVINHATRNICLQQFASNRLTLKAGWIGCHHCRCSFSDTDQECGDELSNVWGHTSRNVKVALRTFLIR